MTPTTEKNIRFCRKTDNPAAIDLLHFYLEHYDREVREQAFEGLFFKKAPERMSELFGLIHKDERKWISLKFLTSERLSRIVEVILRGNDIDMAQFACSLIVRHKLYETIPVLNSLLERPKPEWIELSATTTLQLAERFYEELAAAKSGLELRNMDRRRQWFAAQLEETVRKFSIHHREEPIKALLLVAQKNYPLLTNIFDDVHSKACKTAIRLLRESKGGGFYRLLFSYLGDVETPQIINEILFQKDEKNFVQYLLKYVTPSPTPTMKDALKRFTKFSWIQPDNIKLADLVKGEEASFIQLVVNASLPREIVLAMFEFIFRSNSVEGKRIAAMAIRTFSGEDVNRILILAASDADPVVCSTIIRIIKSRNLKEADQIIMQNVDRPDSLVRQTIYELMPEFRVENYLQRISQIPDEVATLLGRIVLTVDPNVQRRLDEDIASAVPHRRRIAIDAIRFMNIGENYENKLITILEKDDEVNVRVAACMALGKVLTPTAYQTLQWAFRDRNVMVQRAAAESLESLQDSYHFQPQ